MSSHVDEWDPKITTFPGVYLIGVLHATILHLLGLVPPFCSIYALRSLNILFATGNAWLILRLREILMVRFIFKYIIKIIESASERQASDHNKILHSIMVISFPINFFFSFLYYTDSGATFFVLLSYWLASRVSLVVLPSSPFSFLPSAIVCCRYIDGRLIVLKPYLHCCQAAAVAILFRQTNIIWLLFVAGNIVIGIVECRHGVKIYGCVLK